MSVYCQTLEQSKCFVIYYWHLHCHWSVHCRSEKDGLCACVHTKVFSKQHSHVTLYTKNNHHVNDEVVKHCSFYWTSLRSCWRRYRPSIVIYSDQCWDIWTGLEDMLHSQNEDYALNGLMCSPQRSCAAGPSEHQQNKAVYWQVLWARPRGCFQPENTDNVLQNDVCLSIFFIYWNI